MKKTILFSTIFLAAVAFSFYAFTPSAPAVKPTTIQWMSIEDALEAQKKNPKPVFVNIYTSWCKWCKVMDAQTFTDAEIINTLNEDYYPVKFNAEQQTPIELNGRKYEFMKTTRGRGIHQLAFELLDQRAGFPSSVILSQGLRDKEVLKGFKKPEQLKEALKR